MKKSLIPQPRINDRRARTISCCIAALFALLPVMATGATVISIGNASFETVGAELVVDTWYSLPEPGDWDDSKSDAYDILDLAGETIHFTGDVAPNGEHVLNLDAATVSQNLSYAISAGDQLSMSFYVGESMQEGTTNGGVTAYFTLGGSVVYNETVANNAVDGGFALENVTWTATSGGNLGIRFEAATENGAWLDAVSLEVTPVPEPSTSLLICVTLGMLMIRRRR